MKLRCRSCGAQFNVTCPDCRGGAIEAAEPEKLTDEEKREFARMLEDEPQENINGK
jgi:hypothetical protein